MGSRQNISRLSNMSWWMVKWRSWNKNWYQWWSHLCFSTFNCKISLPLYYLLLQFLTFELKKKKKAFAVHIDFTINSVPVPTLEQTVLIFVFMSCVIVFFMIILGIAFYLDKKAIEPHSLHLTYGGNFKDRWVELFSQNLKERVRFSLFSLFS